MYQVKKRDGKIAAFNLAKISEAIRKLLFSDSDSLSVLIHKELVKQQIFNLLQNTKMPRQTREKLIEEVNKID